MMDDLPSINFVIRSTVCSNPSCQVFDKQLEVEMPNNLSGVVCGPCGSIAQVVP